eukprot:8128766-Pyramimonas_sp.AAC.1
MGPTEGALAGHPPQDDQPRGGEDPEGSAERLKGYTQAGLARQRAPSGQMEYWLAQGWSEHQTRHWHSLHEVKRDDGGKITRSTRTGPTKSPVRWSRATSRGLSPRSESSTEASVAHAPNTLTAGSVAP